MGSAADPAAAMQAFKPPASAAGGWREWLVAHAALTQAAWPEAMAQARRW